MSAAADRQARTAPLTAVLAGRSVARIGDGRFARPLRATWSTESRGLARVAAVPSSRDN